ncbi:unnamed protein product [Linum tenue]|uniref:AAA ATPase AAA+ lid domain-containing protein n=1 Tax=Linum tenue TaxID=586396 RepID=A0AAV0IKF4_9ROSI|nr:unnamed protein product [Linum tenue]
MGGSSETKVLQELLLYAASAALSCLVLFAGLRHLDPNKDAAKKSLEQKKEIAKRLGRPLIQTNPYEDVIACDEALYELVILPLRRPELFSHGKLLGPQKGVILKDESVERNIDFNYIASLCDGYTGSDIFELCKKAAYFPIRDLLDEEKKGKKHQSSDDDHVHATISELSKLVVSQILNLQPDSRDEVEDEH